MHLQHLKHVWIARDSQPVNDTTSSSAMPFSNFPIMQQMMPLYETLFLQRGKALD